MAQVILSRAAVLHICYCFNERALRSVPGVSVDSAKTRRNFIRAALDMADPMMFWLTDDELRALDTLLTDVDPRAGKTPDGAPVLNLVETIWRAMIGEIGKPDAIATDTADDHADHYAEQGAD